MWGAALFQSNLGLEPFWMVFQSRRFSHHALLDEQAQVLPAPCERKM